MMFKELKPNNNLKGVPYIKYSPRGYLTLNKAAGQRALELYGYPEHANIYIDEDIKTLRIEFRPDGKYSVTCSNCRNYQISFRYGHHIGVVSKRYTDLTFAKKHIDMRYEVCKKEAEQE